MDENITEKNGKYIVFCKDIKDMEEKQAKAKEWFGKIDEEQTIYRVSSKHNDSQDQLDKFNNDESEHLKLMYCVGMIDEGMHLNDVSGVILTAKTGSRPTYLQRIGRAISSGKDKKQSIVIDLANNNEILVQNKCYEEGYQITDIEALRGVIDWINEKNNGELPDCENSKTYKEEVMSKRLRRINNKYYKYIENEELLDSLDEEKRKEIEEILMLGEDISLWEDYIEIEDENEKLINANINDFLSNIEIKGARKDFQKLLEDIQYQKETYEEIIEFLEENRRIPKSTFKEKGKKKKAAEMTEEERNEMRLYDRWKYSQEYKILKEYAGRDIEEVPEEYREKIEKLRSYGLGQKEKTMYEEIIEFLEKNGREPKVTWIGYNNLDKKDKDML